MCGIFGSINILLDDNEIKKILLNMNHRGPDSNGIFKDNNNDDFSLIIGHSRLEILDIAGGGQPMISRDGNYVVAYNGEIYNFIELRLNLEKLGHKFESNNSDTEILIHGYKQWGKNLTNYLNGMWSFVIYDKLNKRIFLSRDRFGEKPLFYYIKNNTFIFSSELSGITNIKNLNLNLNYLNLKKYCAYGYFPSTLTPYDNIFKLEPGHNLFLNIKKFNIIKEKYWEYKLEPNYSINENDWADEIFYLLNDSIKKRLIADVPIGVFLSGGLDSSIISLLSQKNSTKKNKYFLYRF